MMQLKCAVLWGSIKLLHKLWKYLLLYTRPIFLMYHLLPCYAYATSMMSVCLSLMLVDYDHTVSATKSVNQYMIE